ncbi:hypothetical protein L3Q82_009999 [Scortum barcoo]|uniref:Uncharacterized protein n=1 Tax=Scortum barcoo TaxID=214431 RepID=A0ACB8WER4_9TELE|nr:hypothetical protein L3Q82_009999 [Scortum barcoo]
MSHREEAPGRPRTRWRDYVSQLAWERLGVPPEELEEVSGEQFEFALRAVDKEVNVILRSAPVCPPRPSSPRCQTPIFLSVVLMMMVIMMKLLFLSGRSLELCTQSIANKNEEEEEEEMDGHSSVIVPDRVMTVIAPQTPGLIIPSKQTVFTASFPADSSVTH